MLSFIESEESNTSPAYGWEIRSIAALWMTRFSIPQSFNPSLPQSLTPSLSIPDRPRLHFLLQLLPVEQIPVAAAPPHQLGVCPLFDDRPLIQH